MKRSPSVLFDMEEYPPFLGFPREAVMFFKRLKRNNNRAWFEKHRNEYEECAKQPMQSLVASLRPHFERFAPEYDLNPKRSIFRIYRDTRFSKDKTPYKTHVAAHFVLRGMAKGFVGSGYYVDMEPGGCFAGAGIYMPESDQLKKIRAAIASESDRFLSVINDRSFKKRFGKLEGARLQRMPKGYDEGHPMEEYLKLKQFFVGGSMPESRAFSPKFLDDVAAICEAATPLVLFLNDATRGVKVGR